MVFGYFLAALACLGGLIIIRLGRKTDCLTLSWSRLIEISLQRLVSVHAVDVSENILESQLDIRGVQRGGLNE